MKCISYFFVVCFTLLAGNGLYGGPFFDKFNSCTRQKLEEFGDKNLSEFSGHVFYPFGGPDVTYPLVMFPNLSSLTLVGLEPTSVPESIIPELDSASWSNLASLYKRSFFITDQMALGLKSVAALILKQLENLGATDITVKGIDGRENAVQIKCTYNGKERTIRYYKADLIDFQIDIEFLQSLKPLDVVFFKAASYLPHQKMFSKFREFVLDNASNFVQDSTGVPYEYLKDKFDLTLHGQYLMPYRFPGGFEQNSFRKYSEELCSALLNFSFGYGGGYVPTNVLVAKKRPQLAL